MMVMTGGHFLSVLTITGMPEPRVSLLGGSWLGPPGMGVCCGTAGQIPTPLMRANWMPPIIAKPTMASGPLCTVSPAPANALLLMGFQESSMPLSCTRPQSMVGNNLPTPATNCEATSNLRGLDPHSINNISKWVNSNRGIAEALDGLEG